MLSAAHSMRLEGEGVVAADEDQAELTVMAENRFVLHATVLAWRIITAVLGFGAILAGLAIEFGPDTTKGAIPFRLMENLQVPNGIFAWLTVVGGALLLMRPIATWGHFLLGVCFGWWGLVIFYTVIFQHMESSLVSCAWSITLAGVHLVAGGGRMMIMQFMRTLPKVQGADGAHE